MSGSIAREGQLWVALRRSLTGQLRPYVCIADCGHTTSIVVPAAAAGTSSNPLSAQSASPILRRNASQRESAWSERSSPSPFMLVSPGTRSAYARSSHWKASSGSWRAACRFRDNGCRAHPRFCSGLALLAVTIRVRLSRCVRHAACYPRTGGAAFIAASTRLIRTGAAHALVPPHIRAD